MDRLETPRWEHEAGPAGRVRMCFSAPAAIHFFTLVCHPSSALTKPSEIQDGLMKGASRVDDGCTKITIVQPLVPPRWWIRGYIQEISSTGTSMPSVIIPCSCHLPRYTLFFSTEWKNNLLNIRT